MPNRLSDPRKVWSNTWAGTPTGWPSPMRGSWKVTDTHVTFSWCDRENGYQKKTETISGTEFLKRFLDHIVPPYFRRIRQPGIPGLAEQKTKSESNTPKPWARTATPCTAFAGSGFWNCVLASTPCSGVEDCGGVLQLLESWPGQRAPPVNALTGMCQ